MKRFSATYSSNGISCRMTFEAADLEAARAQAARWGVGVEGEALETAASVAPALPVAYDLPTACALLGNVSRATIYNWLVAGKLERVPESRRVLITRRSMERMAGAQKAA